MTEHRHARLALRLLASRQRHAPPDLLSDRAATVAEMRRALRTRARVALAVRMVLAAAAIALLIGGALAWQKAGPTTASSPTPVLSPPRVAASAVILGTGSATVARNGTVLPVDSAGRLQRGDRMRAQAAAVRVSLSTGTRLALTGDMELVDFEPSQRFTLHSGRVRADVAKLDAPHRFVIDTHDSAIEVKGTSFEVSVQSATEDPGLRWTDLRVFEGIVLVRHAGRERQVGAGEHWSSRPLPALPATTRPAPARVPPRIRPRPPQATPVEEAASSLSQQTDLFTAALAQHRAGNLPEALRLIDDLLGRFPSGSLAESARAERRKLLARMRGPER